MKEKQYTIPIFIPELACPFRCSYCNQHHISHQFTSLSFDEIHSTIETYITTFPSHSIKKVAFFGGSFTGMSIDEQNQYLDIVAPFIQRGEIDSIQLSTRPDYINEEILINLKKHHVSLIELGAQSLDDGVLLQCGRGHTAKDVEKAAQLIHQYDFELGLQMMIGLPGDCREKLLATAQKFIELKTQHTRIYPTLVIKNTELEQLYLQNKYTPLSIEEAVASSAELMELFEKQNINILRVGLHPSEGLRTGESLVAGPFHISFKELVLSYRWKLILNKALIEKQGDSLTVEVAPSQLNAAIGYQASNKKELQQHFKNVKFCGNLALKNYEYHIHF